MTEVRERCVFDTNSVEATRALGRAVGRSLVGGLSIGLVGQLGAGKTLLVKGIAAGNDWSRPEAVTSPTFTLVHEYPGRLTLYHVDMYRLRGAADLLSLGFDEWVRPDAVVVVEWAERVREVIPADALWITIEVTGETCRRLTCEATGPTARRCLSALRSDDG